jgi:hypothetical protein
LSGDKPDTGKQDQQESDLGKDDSRLTARETDVSYFDKSELPDDPARKLTHYPTPTDLEIVVMACQRRRFPLLHQ